MIDLSPAALTKVAHLLAREGRDDLALRVAVQPGGCSGLRYQLYFDDRNLEGDESVLHETPAGDVRVVVDRTSSPYLVGASISYRDDLEGQGFTIDNPNAVHTCACGDSFS